MTIFLWACICWCLLNAVAGVVCLATGHVLRRTKLSLSLDVITSIGVALWAVTLLAGA